MPPNHRSVTAPQLQTFKGRRVTVALQNGARIAGTLQDWDQFMNLSLVDCEDAEKRRFGSAVLRGNAVVSIQ